MGELVSRYVLVTLERAGGELELVLSVSERPLGPALWKKRCSVEAYRDAKDRFVEELYRALEFWKGFCPRSKNEEPSRDLEELRRRWRALIRDGASKALREVANMLLEIQEYELLVARLRLSGEHESAETYERVLAKLYTRLIRLTTDAAMRAAEEPVPTEAHWLSAALAPMSERRAMLVKKLRSGAPRTRFA